MINGPHFLVKNYMRIIGSRHSALDRARGRVVLLSAVFILAYILIGVRVFDLAIIEGAPVDGEPSSYVS